MGSGGAQQFQDTVCVLQQCMAHLQTCSAPLVTSALLHPCRDQGKEFAAGLLAPVSGAATTAIVLLAGATALAAYGGWVEGDHRHMQAGRLPLQCSSSTRRPPRAIPPRLLAPQGSTWARCWPRWAASAWPWALPCSR